MEYGCLLEAVSLSLENSTSTTTSSPPPRHTPPPQGDTPRQRLIDGIVYSRKFILTYHICVLISIALFTVSHWANVLVRRRRRKDSKWQTSQTECSVEGFVSRSENSHRSGAKRKEAVDIVTELPYSESSSSTGSASPVSLVSTVHERSFLLPSRHLHPSGHTFLNLTKALLMYQPRPVPFINKQISSNGTSFAVLLLIGLNLFYCSYNMEFSLRNIFILADRWGLMFVANLPLLYLFAAKNQPLRILTGRSYESLNIFHRRLGELLCLQALLHMISMTATWYILIRPTGRLNFKQYLMLPVIYFGLGAFFAYELLYLTALGSFRQRFYELFLASHVFLQIIALVFVYLHHPVGQIYVGIALAISLIDRIVFRVFVNSTNTIASARILEDGETIKLISSVNIRQHGRRTITAGWNPTDHIFITTPVLGRFHALEAHPFTIASAAPTRSSGPTSLELLIRAQSGFSRDLLNYVHRHDSLPVRIDGPYGSSHARHLLEDSKLSIVVAGGSGIAVAWPLIAHLTPYHDPESISPLPSRKVVLIWVIHQDTHISWLSSASLQQAKDRGVEVVIPRPTEEAGRPDLKSMIRDVVWEYDRFGGGKVGVVVSGPDGMNRSIRNACAGLVWEGRNVGVCVEKFGW